MPRPPMLEGPRLLPHRGQPRQLVVFVHGYGADGNDLIALGEQWRAALPEAAFVAPHAPLRCDMNPMGFQWFPIGAMRPEEIAAGAQAAAPALSAFLDAELARHSLDDAALALVGFSQGTMMALEVGLHRAAAPAAIIGYSGALAGAERLADEIRARPPVFLAHGADDDMIPVGALHEAVRVLGAAGLRVRWHVSPGVGHGIDGAAMALGGRFLRDAFAGAFRMPQEP